MTAREMFEELGYDMQTIDRWDNIIYSASVPNGIFETIRVIFFDTSKKRYIAEEDRRSMIIDIPTMKAIIKQCEELGWM